MSQNIVIENTLYSLLLYWLIKTPKNTVYILDSTIDSKVVKNIKKDNLVFVFDSKFNKNLLYRLFRVYIYEKLRLKLFLLINRVKTLDIYGNDDLISFDIFRKERYSILEDGIVNYNFTCRIKDNFFYNYIRGYRYGKPYGLSIRCKKIYLTGVKDIPKEIESKVDIIDLKYLWDKKSIDEKEYILKLFDIDRDFLKDLTSRDTILLTQPISEDLLCTEDEKIEIYSKIIKEYGAKNLIIKVHPREQTNYRKYFQDALIIYKPFPSELFMLLNIKFKRAVTLFSTAVYSFGKDTKVVWKGTTVHPSLVKTRGVL